VSGRSGGVEEHERKKYWTAKMEIKKEKKIKKKKKNLNPTPPPGKKNCNIIQKKKWVGGCIKWGAVYSI
jgi:hypothetical protein